MGGIGLRVQEEHLVAVEAEEFFRLAAVESVAENRLRRIIILLVIEAVHAPKIRNPAFRGHPCPAEKYYIVVFLHNFLQFFDDFPIIFHNNPLSFIVLNFA